MTVNYGMIYASVLSCILALSEFNITTHNVQSQDSIRRSSCFDTVAPTGHNHPAFLYDNNYHLILSQSRRQDQKRIEIRMIIIRDVSCETIEEHIFY